MNINLKCYTQKKFADQITPIGIYLNVRDLFPGSILLESSEIDDTANAHSIICTNIIGGFQLTSKGIVQYFKSNRTEKPMESFERIQDEMQSFFQSVTIQGEYDGINGFFGFQAFESIRFFETKKANVCPVLPENISIIDYRLYQYVISINHFNGEVTFIENADPASPSTLTGFVAKVLTARHSTYPFAITSAEFSNCTDEQFINNVRKAKAHCNRGDVFQMVLSRRFSRNYKGDEFNLYRALRHINPSPYMFFFDFGSYKIFGSSPEAQIRINDNEATVNPIAGTYKRTGDKLQDEQRAKDLLLDKKELAEHAMLVDLARNDLSKHCSEVQVAAYKSIHKYSHVIHMVSTVKGKLDGQHNNVEILADTFPAGTLSGAPKVRAIQILAELENDPRGFYGGSIGFVDFRGNINQAIIIRSFFAQNNTIHYRAGAGVVLHSVPENELQEVNNKLAALRRAIEAAEKL